MHKMDSNNLLAIVAVVAVCIALVNLGVTVNKMSDIKSLTGYAADTGVANLTIESGASLEFTLDFLDWGSGQVDEAPAFAVLDTESTVTDGNWTAVTQGLNLQNDGNCNVTFTLASSNDADGFIGGTTPTYKLKLADNESSSCCGSNSLSTYTTVTGGAQQACDNFGYGASFNLLDVEIELHVPEDAAAGAKTSTITATASCI